MAEPVARVDVGSVFLSGVFFVFAAWWDGYENWTAAERLYLSDYLKSGTRAEAGAKMQSKYTLLQGFNAKGQMLLVVDDEVEAVKGQDGRYGYVLTDDGIKDGLVRLEDVSGVYNDRALHELMGRYVYQNQTLWDFVKRPTYFSLAFFAVALFVAVPKDRARRMVWKHGRRLRGPELATTAEFNTRLGRSKWLRVHLPDGVAFLNEEQNWYDRTFHQALSCWARIPREREAMHFLIVGDSGTGKSAAIRQMLAQISDRGEAAIVYDPAMEYLPLCVSKPHGIVFWGGNANLG